VVNDWTSWRPPAGRSVIAPGVHSPARRRDRGHRRADGSGSIRVLQRISVGSASRDVTPRILLNGRSYRPRSPHYRITRGLPSSPRTASIRASSPTTRSPSTPHLDALPRAAGFGMRRRRRLRHGCRENTATGFKAPSIGRFGCGTCPVQTSKVRAAKWPVRTKPSVVLLDEPDSGIDVGAKPRSTSCEPAAAKRALR